MEVPRLSKSFFRTAESCPWKAWMHHVQRVPSTPSQAGADGIEVHDWRAQVLSGKITQGEAIERASNDEVRRLIPLACVDLYGKKGKKRGIEKWLSCDRFGNITNVKADQKIGGFLDHYALEWEQFPVVIEDLKTGKFQKDDPLERHIYVWLGMLHNGKPATARFDYFWCRSGDRWSFDYEEQEPGHWTVTPSENVPNAQVEHLTHDKYHPVFAQVVAALNMLEAMPADPNPGAHCENWYGAPCQFLGHGCPLGANLPEEIVQAQAPATVKAIYDLPLEKRPGAAFLLLRGDLPDDDITPELLSLGMQGVQQLRAGATAVAKRIKEWSWNHNETIPMGNSLYGWKPCKTVDSKAALELLLAHGYGADELSRLVSLSESGIKKIKKTDSELKDLILSVCVDEEGGQEFGVITNSPTAE